jgi:hypothetical protein
MNSSDGIAAPGHDSRHLPAALERVRTLEIGFVLQKHQAGDTPDLLFAHPLYDIQHTTSEF